jgi:hypothetical protein
MRFFFSDRRNEPPPPAEHPPPVPETRPTQTSPAPPPAQRLTDEAVLAYLDASIEGTSGRGPRPRRLDLMERVLELTSGDWPEDEAGAELAWLAGYDERMLELLCHRLILGLVRNPFLDVVGVRASRVTFRALEHCAPQHQLPPRPDA